MKQSIGAFWTKQSKTGNKFWSGSININGQKVDLVMFPNDRRQEGDNQPTLRIYLSEPREQQNTGYQKFTQAKQQFGARQEEVPPHTDNDVPEVRVEDVPF